MNRPPNIVVILVDDLGWRDISAYGSSFYETPRIDALAASGLVYNNGYSSSPVCSPSRASLLSGKYPARVGVTQWIGGHGVGALCDVPYFRELPENEFSLARALRDGGYDTWHVGKWHLGPERCWPEHHGFDVNMGGCEMGSPGKYFAPYGIPTLPDGPDGEYLTDRLTDEAVSLIRTAGETPFFLNLWHYAVHTPIEAPANLVEKYIQKAARLGVDSQAIVDGEPMTAWHLRGKRVQRRLIQSDPVYAAMVENLDSNVGRIIDALADSGKLEDTLIVFSSDNGGLATSEGSPTTNAPLAEGKGWMNDGGVRVPYIVTWPGSIEGGRTTDALITGPDLYPTLLAAAGLQQRPEQHVDGVNVLDEWTDRPAAARGPIFWHYPHYSNQGGTPGAGVRDGDLKLIRFYEDGREQLFNLTDDIEESRDLSEAQPWDRERLGRLLDEWILDVGALIPRPNPYPPDFSQSHIDADCLEEQAAQTPTRPARE